MTSIAKDVVMIPDSTVREIHVVVIMPVPGRTEPDADAKPRSVNRNVATVAPANAVVVPAVPSVVETGVG